MFENSEPLPARPTSRRAYAAGAAAVAVVAVLVLTALAPRWHRAGDDDQRSGSEEVQGGR